MLNGLSLFSGYAGIDLALSEWVKPIMYCEIETYAQGTLLSRMDDGTIPFAPIWNDVTTMDGTKFRGLVDIIYGGFPCQDISSAGKGAGLEGKRSGLFREIVRLLEETKAPFVFLENVSAIRTRGSIEVQEALAGLGYDCRFGVISAAEIGANHKRERWFCLGFNASYADSSKLWLESGWGRREIRKGEGESRNHGEEKFMANADLQRCSGETDASTSENDKGIREGYGRAMSSASNGREHEGVVSDSLCSRLERQWESDAGSYQSKHSFATDRNWWALEPNVGRVAHGVAFRAHRIKACGNGVVPLQVKTAFEILSGIMLPG